MSRPTPERLHLVARAGALAWVLVLPVVLGACGVGQRPSFDDSPTVAGQMTGDSAIDTVLRQLDSVERATFTAEYAITPVIGSPSTASVTQLSGGAQTAVEINGVRFVRRPNGTQTCRVADGECSDGLQPAWVSDTGATPEFAFGDLAKRLRIDALRRTGATSASTEEIAGQRASCVDVPVSGGTKQWCVLPDGVVARFVGGDVRIELTSYRPEGDSTLVP